MHLGDALVEQRSASFELKRAIIDLGVSSEVAVARTAAALTGEYGGIDVVVSNAAARITPDRSQQEQADEFIDVANGGTHAMLRSFGPVLRPGGRLIVVASSFGTLGSLDERLIPELAHGPTHNHPGESIQ